MRLVCESGVSLQYLSSATQTIVRDDIKAAMQGKVLITLEIFLISVWTNRRPADLQASQESGSGQVLVRPSKTVMGIELAWRETCLGQQRDILIIEMATNRKSDRARLKMKIFLKT